MGKRHSRQRELFQQCRPEILIFNYCLFFEFDFWPLAIDIDFAFWPTTSGSALMLLWWELSLSSSLYISVYLSLCVCVLPAVRLRKLQTPLIFCFSSVCVFFFLFFALLCVPRFDHELEANLVCLSFQWARQKPNSDSVSNSNSNSPIQFLFVTHSNVLFDWASNGLSGFNLGYITEGWKRVPYRERVSRCAIRNRFPLLNQSGFTQLKPSETTTFHWLQL